MIAIMWQFDVKSGRETEFEQLYGADGDWTTMNRQTRSYLGTSFLRDQQPLRPLRRHRVPGARCSSTSSTVPIAPTCIASLEERRTTLVASVEPVGIFTALNVPDRWGPTWSQRDTS